MNTDQPKTQQFNDYEEVRKTMRNGDIVFLRHGSRLANKITEWVTQSPYYHVGFAQWLYSPTGTERLFMIESHQGGRRVINMAAYSIMAMDIVPLPEVLNWDFISDDMLTHTGEVAYGYADFVAIGLKERLHIYLKDFGGEVCSEMIAKTLAPAISIVDTVISPAQLYKILAPYCAHNGTVVKQYRPS